MKTKTSEVEGAALDWAVAKCEKHDNLRKNPHASDDALIMDGPQGNGVYLSYLSYSTIWAQGGPIIEREKIGIGHAWEGSDWLASAHAVTADVYRGKTALIAAMRCYVASKLGDEIEVPKEIT